MCACPLVLNADNVVATQKGEIVTTPRSSSTPTPLLFAYVNAYNDDTEITISNTSLDNLGTATGYGTCVLNFSGLTPGGPSGSTPTSTSATTAPIAAGQQLVFDISQGGGGIPAAPGFQGYIYADCNFPLARGLARLSYVGSQDAQVIAVPRSASNPQYLLFPYVAPYFDIYISLANTSPIDSGGQAGSCSLYAQGVSIASDSTTTPVATTLPGCDFVSNPDPGVNCFPVVSPGLSGSITAGEVFPNFLGYVTAACRFTGATGTALVTNPNSGFNFSETPELLAVPRPSKVEPLLFSSITNQNGFDTEISIANTGADSLGTAGSSGSCTLNFYGLNAPPPVSTGTIAAGSSYTAGASVVAPGFQGYAIASCSFPYARGTAYRISGGFPDGHSETAELVTTPRSPIPTSLLFSAVSNWPGFDTNFTISNTSEDALGTTPASGTCTISYFGSVFGGGSPPAPETSGTIQPGSQFSFSLSSGNAAEGIAGAPGLRGYVIASCSFPLARGFADVTATPGLSVTMLHTGSFRAGQTNAAYTVTVLNLGVLPTSGAVTVTDTAPAGLTLLSMAGAGWTCATLPTCTRSDVLAAGSSYPPITVTVDVNASATSPQVNSVSVSGGGSVTASATDSTTILPIEAVLSITKTHTGNFSQGQSNATYTVTVDNFAGTAPSSGTVTVTDTIPTGLTLVSMAGDGWTCTTLPTCTRSDVLAAGSSYPAITVTVSVASNSPLYVTNQVTVSGGGSAPASGSDTNLVLPPSGQYLISTYAGGTPTPTAAAAIGYPLSEPAGVAVDQFGDTYVSSGACVFKVDPNGILTRVAGNCTGGYTGDGGLAVNAQLSYPKGVAADSAGNLYIADSGNCVIRKVAANGIITTVAGTGICGYSGDNGPATSAQLSVGGGVAVDSAGNLYIVDYGDCVIRKVSPSGIITTVAGTGTAGYSGDNGPATSAQLSAPLGVAVDSAGDLYIADNQNDVIREVTANGIMTTVAGIAHSQGYTGDNGPATSAQLNQPGGVAVDSAGNLYIADGVSYVIRKVAPNGIITTVAGTGYSGYSGDNGPATSAQLSFPEDVAVDSAGNLYIADTSNNRIRDVNLAGIISTLVGSGLSPSAGDGGPPTLAQFSVYSGVGVDGVGNLYIADWLASYVRKVAPAGVISTVAGNGTYGFSGDGGPATSAAINAPTVTADSAGNIYIFGGAYIRKIDTNGIITTVAGTGVGGYSGDNGPATSAQIPLFYTPLWLAVDSAGNLYFSDDVYNVVRKITPGGIITTVAGKRSEPYTQGGYSGDGGPATSAQLGYPTGLAVDAAGSLYIAEAFNYRVRRVAPNGIISTYAGNGVSGNTGDGGAATSAQLEPGPLTVDPAGNLYIGSGTVVRVVSPGGIINTIAGTGTAGYSGDGGPALKAQLNPYGLAADGFGNIYLADGSSNLVRLLQLSGTAPLLTVAETHTGNFTYGETGANYSVTVSNAALAAPTAGTVTATDPSSLTLVSMAGTGWDCSSNTCTRSDSLAPGASYAPITVTVNVPANAFPQVTSSASVSGGGAIGAASAIDLTNIGAAAAVLEIVSTHAGNFTQGQANATYTLTVGNQAAAAATNGMVTVTETLPSGLSLVSMAGTGWDCTTLPKCTRSDALTGGAGYPPITVTVSVLATAPSPQVNSVSVSGGGSATATTTDSTTIIGVPSLSITKTHAGDFVPGQSNATYTVMISNAASTASTSGTVTVTETIPTGLTLVSMAGAGWTCATLPTCTRSDVLAAGSSYPPITVTVDVAANAASQLTNQVSVSGGGSVSASANDVTSISAIGSCDIGQNGIINVSGLQIIINEALGIAPAVNDPNGDGAVNVADVQIAINAALGLGCTTSSESKRP
jgi:uncharacterized repeat protein (TIGR01451 family)